MHHSHDNTNPQHCPACDYAPFTRNNYFTGKLLVERDFTDEQRYYVDKLRHHHQRLHGWGVVCGLKVKQHPNEACRDRFVCIGPGTAIDCCGHEIILREESCFDFTQMEAIKNLKQNEDTAAHKLQICIRYRECPTEEIPVLYDECGCDDTACAPNRVLESYELGVMLAQKDDTEPFHTPKLEWDSSIGKAHSFRVAQHYASHRLYILTADSPSTLYQLSTDNQVTITSRTLPAKGVELAVSNDGKHVYVVSEPIAPATLRRLLVLDATQPAMPDFNTKLLELPNSATGEVKLAVAPDGRVLTHVAASGAVFRWGADLDTSPTPADAALVQTLTGNPVGLTLSTDGQQAFFLGPSNQIQSLKLSDGTVAKITTTLPTTANLSSMALFGSGGKDLLAMCDATSLKLHLFDTGSAQALLGTVALEHKPIGLVASPASGHWVYVLEKDTAGSFVQPVSVAGMQKTPPDPPGKAFPVGKDSQQIIINNSATRLYIPYVDDLANPALGGVAVVEVSEEACGEILWRDLEGCAHCDQPNCIVLATIENYHLNDHVWDPPAETATDATRHIDRINNRTRRLLPSTQALAELVTCLLEHPAGAGSQGPVGLTGPAGAGVDSADAETIAAGLPAVADFDPIARRIHFKIPKGDKGDPGASGGTGLDDVELTIVNCSTASSAEIAVIENQRVLRLVIPSICDRKLTQISGVNWVHGGTISADAVNRQGLLIAFNHPIRAGDLHDQSVMVLTRQSAAQRAGCWCEVPGRINAVEFRLVGDVLSDFRLMPPATSVNGIQFLPGAAGFTPGPYRVIVKGDFILDAATMKAVDADHLPPWFATPAKHFKIGDYITGDGVQGGTFESWFTVGTP